MSLLESNNKHAKTTREALVNVKNLVNSLDGWELSQEQDKVKIYNKKLTDPSAPPLVRGDTILTDVPPGCTPQDIVAVINLAGCRKVWDDKFDKSEVKEFYTRYESLFWCKQKTPWPISPRDFVGTCIQENETDATYNSIISVQDAQVPATSGTVRAALLVSGWKFYWTSDKKIGITYVSQVDLAGSLPTSFLKKLFLQIPLCAGKIRDYITKYGFIPSLRWYNNNGVEFKGEDFDHDAKKYTAELCVPSEVKGKAVEFICSSRMYPKGVQAQLKGGQGQVEQSLDEHKNHKIILNNLKGSKITVIISKK